MHKTFFKFPYFFGFLLIYSQAQSTDLTDLLKQTEGDYNKGIKEGKRLEKRTKQRAIKRRSSSNSNLKYGCKFYCEGQFGNKRSGEFTAKTPYSNIIAAQEYIRKRYKATCSKYPFYGNSGTGATVSYPRCETY